MNAHFFSGSGGDDVTIVVGDEVYDRSNTLLPVTGGLNRWVYMRHYVAGTHERLGYAAQAITGEMNADGIAILHAGRAAMQAARRGDRAGVVAAARTLQAFGIIPEEGAFFGAIEYWIDRWLRDRD